MFSSWKRIKIHCFDYTARNLADLFFFQTKSTFDTISITSFWIELMDFIALHQLLCMYLWKIIFHDWVINWNNRSHGAHWINGNGLSYVMFSNICFFYMSLWRLVRKMTVLNMYSLYYNLVGFNKLIYNLFRLIT